MKIVREHLNEIKRGMAKSGLSAIGVGHAGTHGEFYKLIEKLMPDSVKMLQEYSQNLDITTLENFDNGDFILNKAAELLECDRKDLYIAWTQNKTSMAGLMHGMGYGESISATFINTAYEMYEEASDCVITDSIDKDDIMTMLEKLNIERTTTPLTTEEEEGWNMIFFPKIRVVWVQLDPNVDDSRDAVVIFR